MKVCRFSCNLLSFFAIIFTFESLRVVKINGMDIYTLFQHKVTGVPIITADGSRFEFTWSIHKDDVALISCEGDCDVIVWVKTGSSNIFKDSFCSCKYAVLYSGRSAASNLPGVVRKLIYFYII